LLQIKCLKKSKEINIFVQVSKNNDFFVIYNNICLFKIVTEEEIGHGIVNFEDANARTFVLFRKIVDISKYSQLNTNLVKKYAESDNDTNSLIKNLKHKIKKKLTSDNIKQFTVNFKFKFCRARIQIFV
jgi:hypothetical protein